MKNIVKNFNQFILEKKQSNYEYDFNNVVLKEGDRVPNYGTVDEVFPDQDQYQIGSKFYKRSIITNYLAKFFTELFDKIEIGTVVKSYGEVTEIFPDQFAFGSEYVHKSIIYSHIIKNFLKGRTMFN